MSETPAQTPETPVLNLMMPGNPRYQPEALRPYFGYDNLYRAVGEVEIANMQVMYDVGMMPVEVSQQLTPDAIRNMLAITTTVIDATEHAITKHDIRAWRHEARKVVPPQLGNWLHLMLTSFDAIDTARILQFVKAHQDVIAPACVRVQRLLIGLIQKYADQLQIGRTHGQHALPITVGFWLATVLHRINYNYLKMQQHVGELVGKISGAVGAYNAQEALDAPTLGPQCYENMVLSRLGLKAAPISTQILPPEPLAYYLCSCAMMSASIAQLGRDCRHLMRSEIGEIREGFSADQAGSSTMAHKRNPINFENMEGMWIRTKNEFGKVLDTLISEHQRDLVGSSVARDFPIIVINLYVQLSNLLRPGEANLSFLERINVDADACMRNFGMHSNVILSEPLYIAIEMAGYEHDAHNLVNHKLVPAAQSSGRPVIELAMQLADEDPEFTAVWERIPNEVVQLLHHPEQYTGLATVKALEIAGRVAESLE